MRKRSIANSSLICYVLNFGKAGAVFNVHYIAPLAYIVYFMEGRI